MKAALAVWFCLLAAQLSAAWPDELTSTPGSFAPLRPFHAHYKFGWALLNAAGADFDFTREKGGVARLNVATHTTGAMRLTWRMDATHTATMLATTMRPILVLQSETYKDETITTKVEFTDLGVSRLRESKPPGEQPAKVKEFEFPRTYDLHSALHFFRSQRLQVGDKYKLVVYPSTAPYLAQVQVIGREKMKVAGKSYSALKLDLKLWRIDKELKLAAHQKFKRASIYLSDDADRVLLRIESEIFVGSVWAELETIEWK